MAALRFFLVAATLAGMSVTFSLDRRSFLEALGLLLLSGCSGSSTTPPPPGGSPIKTPFDAWRLLREAVRSSPDHLGARAQALIAAKDPEAIFAFVRDEISTYPVPRAETGTRWGVRGTLRGGAGSPREKAELLAWMYRQAGFTAEVATGTIAGALAASGAPAKVFGRLVARRFEPGAPPAPYTSWTELLGDSGVAPGFLDPDGRDSLALHQQIAPLLPGDAAASPVSVFMTAVPVVNVTLAGTVRTVNPLLPDASFDTPDVTNLVGSAPADAPVEVKLTLLVSRSDAPEKRLPVATRSFGLDQLVGRQVSASFHPAGAVEDVLGRPLDQLNVFAPVIALSGLDLTADEMGQAPTVGALVTAGGDLVETDAQRRVSFNGAPLDRSAIDPAAVSRVSSVSVEINAQTFPQVELLVRASDAGGVPVPGLPASAFELTEDGKPMQVVMRQNGGALRVLFLLDLTGSQPAPCTDATARAQLGVTLGQALFAAFPGAQAQVAALGTGEPSSSGFTVSGPAALGEAFRGATGGSSLIYRSLADAAGTGASLVVLFTDGDVQDDPAGLAGLRAAAATGAPVLIVGNANAAATVLTPAIEQIASLTAGTFVDAGALTDLAPVIAALEAQLERRAAAPYRLVYQAPRSGPATRALRLSAGSGLGQGSYSPPSTPAPARRLSGVYLVVDLGSEGLTRRTLAGWDSDRAPTAPLPEALFEEVRSFLFGGVLLSFEGGPPSLSTWLDDLYSSALLTEPVAAAASSGDPQRVIGALSEARPVAIPPQLVALHSALPSAPGTPIFEQTARVALFKFGATGARSADLLRFTRFATFGASSDQAAFEHTLRGSLRLAVAERALFEESTASLLAGKALRLLLNGAVSASDLSFFPEASREPMAGLLARWADHYRLVAADGSTLAFWAIDPRSGSAIGVLPDGSGGGSSAACQALAGIDGYFQLLSLLATLLAIPGASILLLIGKVTAVAAIEAAMCFGNGPLPPGFGDPNSIACEAAVSMLGDKVGEALPGGVENRFVEFFKGQVGESIAGAAVGCVGLPTGC